MQQIPNDYILASDAEREYGLYAGAIRQAIHRKRIKPEECVKLGGIWFVDRRAIERLWKTKRV